MVGGGSAEPHGAASCSQAFETRLRTCDKPVAAAPTSMAASPPQRRRRATSTHAGRRLASTPIGSTLSCSPSPTPAQQERFRGELFPAEAAADPHGTRFLDYFQQDKLTGEPKGIVAIDLEELP